MTMHAVTMIIHVVTMTMSPLLSLSGSLVPAANKQHCYHDDARGYRDNTCSNHDNVSSTFFVRFTAANKQHCYHDNARGYRDNTCGNHDNTLGDRDNTLLL